MRTESFRTTRPLGLAVKLPRGAVSVETADVEETTVTLSGGTARAEEQIAQATVRLDDRGDRDELLVDVDSDDISFGGERVKLAISFGRKDSIDVRIVCPHGADLGVETGSADIRAAGRFGTVTTRTGSGDVRVDDVERDADVKVASGDVRIASVGGSLKVQTAAGDIAAGSVGGSAQVKSAAGDVILKEVAHDVAVTSASGDVHVASVEQGKVELKSVSGDLVVGVKRGSRVWMDVKTVTGDARSDLDSGAEDDGDGPLVELKATAMSGDIRIVRA